MSSSKEKSIVTERALGAAILRKLDVLGDYVKAFEEKGMIIRSEEPYGFGYYINEEEQQKVDRMAEKGDYVYAVISGVYQLEDCSVKMVSYLFVTDKDLKRAALNLDKKKDLLDGIIAFYDEEKGYCLRAKVEGLYDEIGDICVKGRLGGLTRTM